MQTNKDLLQNVQYIILPGQLPPGSPWTQLHNRVYRYWVEFWHKVFLSNKVEERVDFKAAFFRMSAIPVLMHQEQIVGLHMYCFFNIEQDSNSDHDYFQSERGSKFIEILKSRNVSQVMSMEFLTIDPAWRKRSVGVSLGAILGSLGSRIQRSTGVGASTTIARKDLGVDALARDFGFENVTEGLSMFNTPVVFQCLFSDRIGELSDPESKNYVDRFWSNRIDTTNLTYSKTENKRIAA